LIGISARKNEQSEKLKNTRSALDRLEKHEKPEKTRKKAILTFLKVQCDRLGLVKWLPEAKNEVKKAKISRETVKSKKQCSTDPMC